MDYLKDPGIKRNRIMVIVFFIFALICLVFTIVTFSIDKYKTMTYDKVNAIVIDYNIEDSQNVWTEFEYEYNGETYKNKRKGNSTYTRKDDVVEILVNPNNANKFEIVKQMYTYARIGAFFTVIFSIIYIYLMVLYVKVKKEIKKLYDEAKAEGKEEELFYGEL